ncbi:DUF1501 domain-containing protein [Pseudoroseomonas wenyumeiae]|uniref:DUF1501 domain-containing protein n=1 Tax=Teichococcus wenyumeiae TaxID=2478470 RepID=A0A3A9JQA7_9PROT|nr:DUF1501 domain-containing protein [Pseudoroseomonas wenyumeiae]RKK06116.1 DUF1501 domain-containing protein [Pseudoroseomonas wenyumeiae]RMI25605.1 DUF1501 domain-containing protein [Pseudoroseomonas wenyumeiae]
MSKTSLHLPRLGRRGLLLGLSAMAVAGQARLALAQPAATPQEARLVVVLLRGALDGLAAVQAYGDADFAALRGPLALPEPGNEEGLLDLGGFFGLHPTLAQVHEMYRANQALIVHAAAGSYRTRSHFDAQDMLESGASERLSSGWLNRALEAIPDRPGADARTGLAVGLDMPLLLRGKVPVGMYASPRGGRPDPDLYARFADLAHDDPLLGPAVMEGLRARGFAADRLDDGLRKAGGFPSLCGIAGRLLADPAGPRVAALETGGWDTHSSQMSRLNYPLRQLDEGLGSLKAQLGSAWQHTAVLVMTEFGRTVRANGNQGTDHGTGGVAFLLGGAIAGGRVAADWPGLGAGKLLEDRDLQPTVDLREIAKGLLRDHLRLPATALEAAFPDSREVVPKGGLLAT